MWDIYKQFCDTCFSLGNQMIQKCRRLRSSELETFKIPEENAQGVIDYLKENHFSGGIDDRTFFSGREKITPTKKASEYCGNCDQITCSYLCSNEQIFKLDGVELKIEN